MRKILIIAIITVILIILAGKLFTNIAGERIMEKFINYTPESKELNFTFMYPKSWKISETKGMHEDYSEVFMLGRSNAEKTTRASIALAVYPIRSLRDYSGLESYCDDYISKRTAFNNFKLMDRSHKDLYEKNVIHLEFEYMLRLPLYSANAMDVLVKSDVIIFERDGKLYNFAYENDGRGFKIGLFVFEKILKSLRFQAK